MTAQTCRQLGFNIVPLSPKSKIPIPGFDLQRYFSENYTGEIPEGFNYAVICGKISNLIVIDIDGTEAMNEWVKRVAQVPTLLAKIEKTLMVKTGSGGFHIYFRTSEFTDGIKKIKLWRGKDEHSEIEIRGNGSYVVGPGCVHPNGNIYEPKGSIVVPITKEEHGRLLEIFGKGEDLRSSRPMDEPDYTNGLTPEKIQLLLEKLKPQYTKGRRDEIVFCLSGALRKSGVPLSNTEMFVRLLCKLTGDEEEDMRVLAVRQTYSKPIARVKGFSGLREVLG